MTVKQRPLAVEGRENCRSWRGGVSARPIGLELGDHLSTQQQSLVGEEASYHAAREAPRAAQGIQRIGVVTHR